MSTNAIAELPPIPAQDTAEGKALAVMAAKARALASSDIIPAHYRGKPGNVIVAMELADRMGMSPLMVMQQSYVLEGKLSFSSQLAIALANKSEKFIGGVRFRYEGQGDARRCTAHAKLREDGETVERSLTLADAKAAGWRSKAWQQAPDQMLAYRAAAYLVRLYAPEATLGIPTVEELRDLEPEPVALPPAAETVTNLLDEAKAIVSGKPAEPEPIDVQEEPAPYDGEPAEEPKGREATCGQTHYEEPAKAEDAVMDLRRSIMSASQGLTNDAKRKAASEAFCPEIAKGVRWGEYVRSLGMDDATRLIEALEDMERSMKEGA